MAPFNLDHLKPNALVRGPLFPAPVQVIVVILLKQIEVNLAEAAHRSVFVAAWRPAIGWVCALALLWAFIMQPASTWAITTFDLGVAVPAIVTDHLFELVLAMLGMAGLRTFEKTKVR